MGRFLPHAVKCRRDVDHIFGLCALGVGGPILAGCVGTFAISTGFRLRMRGIFQRVRPVRGTYIVNIQYRGIGFAKVDDTLMGTPQSLLRFALFL